MTNIVTNKGLFVTNSLIIPIPQISLSSPFKVLKMNQNLYSRQSYPLIATSPHPRHRRPPGRRCVSHSPIPPFSLSPTGKILEMSQKPF